MELKSNIQSIIWKQAKVLIVPLWNWNFPCALLISLIWSGFNRTFMELKYLLFDDVQNPRNTF